jgi:hypothetical protein
MIRKFDAGPALVAFGAILLLVALFLRWFDPGGNAWEVFEALDLILAGLALAALAAAAGRLGEGARAVAAIAIAAFVVVAVQLVDPPPFVHGSDRQIGAWLAFAASGVMVAGAVLMLTSISIVIDVRGRDVRRRVAAVDRRTEPQPDGAAPTPAPAGKPASSSLLRDEQPTQRTEAFAPVPPDDAEGKV